MTFIAEVNRGTFTGRDPLFSERVLISQDRYNEAIVALGTKIRMHPKWPEPWAVLGLALSLAGRFDESLTAVDHALALEPEHAFAQELKTGLLLHLGVHAAAVDAAERLVELRPRRAESHAFLAFAHAFAGNELSAHVAATQSRQLAPNRAIGYQASCVANLAFNNFSQAEQNALMALALDKPSASVFHDLGVALAGQGKHDAAQKAFEAAGQLDSRFVALGRFAPTYRRGPSLVLALNATLLSGLALLLVARSPLLFTVVAFFGVVSLIFAIRIAIRRSPTWKDAVQPVFWGVVFTGIVMTLRHYGIGI